MRRIWLELCGPALFTTCLALLLATGCRPDRPARIVSLNDPAGGVSFSGGRVPPSSAREFDRETRWSLPGDEFRLATGGFSGDLLLAAGTAEGPCTVSVELEKNGSRDVLHEWVVPIGRWGDTRLPVPAAPRSAQLLVRLAAGDPEQCRWSSSAFVPATLKAEVPNVLLILGDTVRRDALGAYGAPAGATPVLDALAASGIRFDQARAQSSWTLPSVASLFTSRWCHEVTNWADQGEKIPEAATTLAELFRARGYATAGFTANVLLQKDTGFAQGFENWWVPPTERSLWTDALTSADRVVRWLDVHQRRPFLCYVHLVDPHSPYCPPERRPKDAASRVPGDMSRSFWGKRPLPDAAELSEWRRLYAEEVRLLDRGVGRILAVLEPEVRQRTYVVFVSDHGEEFLEHGFIGHGWSLYDELLRVPLLVAGPGLPAGRVVREPVGLVDLLPTLAALAGIPAPAPSGSWRGIDLASRLRAGPLPSDRTFLAQTYHYAPLRLAVQRGLTKAVFFNRGPEKVAAPTARTFGAPRVRALLPVEAYFDLSRDPGEKANLADQPDTLPAMRAARDTLLRALSGVLPGTWFVMRGPGGGGRVTGTVRYNVAPKRLVPLFAREGESVRLAGSEVRVSLRDDKSLGAWLFPDVANERIAQVSLSADGVVLPGRGAAQRILEGPGWASFSVVGRGPFDSPKREAEQVERLRALGYLR